MKSMELSGEQYAKLFEQNQDVLANNAARQRQYQDDFGKQELKILIKNGENKKTRLRLIEQVEEVIKEVDEFPHQPDDQVFEQDKQICRNDALKAMFHISRLPDIVEDMDLVMAHRMVNAVQYSWHWALVRKGIIHKMAPGPVVGK